MIVKGKNETCRNSNSNTNLANQRCYEGLFERKRIKLHGGLNFSSKKGNDYHVMAARRAILTKIGVRKKYP